MVRIAAGLLAGVAVAAVLWWWAGPSTAVIARPTPPVRILLWVSPVRAAPEIVPVQ